MKKTLGILFLLTSLLLFGCSKDSPPSGTYKGAFRYNNGQTAYSTVEITEQSENIILIDGFSFQMDGKKIEGQWGTMELKGEWSHPFNDARYFIKGAFIYHSYSHFGYEGDFYGTFEIKSF
jgi:hypothetical protein